MGNLEEALQKTLIKEVKQLLLMSHSHSLIFITQCIPAPLLEYVHLYQRAPLFTHAAVQKYQSDGNMCANTSDPVMDHTFVSFQTS